jgi:hypothetical protein
MSPITSEFKSWRKLALPNGKANVTYLPSDIDRRDRVPATFAYMNSATRK